MGLVDYGSDSESDGEIFGRGTLTSTDESDHLSAPSLPESFYSQYTTNPRLNHPDFHQGRSRVINHVSGFFPSHIYIQWIPTSKEVDSLNDLVSSLQAANPSYKIESLVMSPLKAPLPLHISLSDTILLSNQQKTEFLQTILELLNSMRPIHSENGLCVNNVPVMLFNADNSRIFLSLPLRKDENYAWLQEVVAGINEKEVTQKYGFSPLPTGNLHVSIAWTLPVPGKEFRDQLKLIDEPNFSSSIRQFRIPCDALHLKIGSQVQVIKLKSASCF